VERTWSNQLDRLVRIDHQDPVPHWGLLLVAANGACVQSGTLSALSAHLTGVPVRFGDPLFVFNCLLTWLSGRGVFYSWDVEAKSHESAISSDNAPPCRPTRTVARLYADRVLDRPACRARASSRA